MGTSAFDKLWETPKRRGSDFDALWGDDPIPRDDGKPRGFRTPEQIARLNKADVDQAADDSDTAWREGAGKALGVLAAPLSEVPGGKALQAFVAGTDEGGYGKGLENIEGAIASAPMAARIPAKLLGAGVSTAVLPGSVAMQGARYGVGRGLLQADPDRDFGGRVQDAALEGTAGLVVGKGAELVGTAARGLLAKTPARNLLNRTQARTDASAPAYKAFRDLGELDETPALKELLELPAIRRAVETVKGESPVLAKLADTDTKVLDAVYKRVGNKAFKAQHGFETGEAQTALKAALEEAAQLKGGSYTAAVDPFAEASRGIEGVKRGLQSLKDAGSPSGGPLSRVTKTSPEALEKWAGTASAADRAAAAEGITGQLGHSRLLSRAQIAGTSFPVPWPSKALRKAPGLLRAVEGEGGLADLLRALGAR